MNISVDIKVTSLTGTPDALAELFRLLAQPARLQILSAIGDQQVCVCHLKAALGLRQAYISQQLMTLRNVGVVASQREGRNIYYRLADPRLLDVIAQAAALLGADSISEILPQVGYVEGCPCPQCSATAGKSPDPESCE